MANYAESLTPVSPGYLAARNSATALGIMAAHALAYWYDACERAGSWAFIRQLCPNRELARLAYDAYRSIAFSDAVEAHRRCALAIVLAWRDRVSHG